MGLCPTAFGRSPGYFSPKEKELFTLMGDFKGTVQAGTPMTVPEEDTLLNEVVAVCDRLISFGQKYPGESEGLAPRFRL